MLRGSLFTQEYLFEGIKDSEAWKELDESALAALRAACVTSVFERSAG
jgi:hypothetical protein